MQKGSHNMIDIRMTKARSSLIISQPFFGTLALYLELVEDPAVETMATDGKKLFYAPAFLDEHTPDEVKGVIVHEVLHCAYRHPVRRKTREHELWNIACDYAINMDVIAAGFTLPADRLLDDAYQGMSAEEIYTRLARGKLKAVPPTPGAGSGPNPAPSKGQGTGLGPSQATPLAGSPTNPAGGSPGAAGKGPNSGPTLPNGPCPWGKVLDPVPSHNTADAQAIENEWKVRVLQAAAIAGKKAGNVAGTLSRLVENTKAPSHDWREELRRFIDDKVHTDFTWTNPNKRHLSSGYVMPGIQKDSIAKLGIAIDTSSSIDKALLSKFRAQVQEVLDNGSVQEVMVLYCDTKVQGYVRSFTAGDIVDMQALGGGGTKFSPAIKWFTENEPDLTALIYFTDLDCNDFGPEPPFEVMWAAYGYESKLRNKTVPFGEIVKLLEN